MESVLLSVDERGIATLKLNRQECHNAIDSDCADLLTANLETLSEDEDIRAVILTGTGISFSAGHDIDALRSHVAASQETLAQQIRQYARLLHTLDTLNKPTIARVQGAAFGLGVGLIACCDFAIGAADALFGFSEVRQGNIPGVVTPYVVRAIGARAARRYLIGSERFNAGKAKRLGLLHQEVQHAMLDNTVEQLIRQLLINGPIAMNETKRLIREIEHQSISEPNMERLIEQTASIRISHEGQEGIAAFIEHRKPGWIK
jgi:methylglutaconyl-CoA hydratase